jgi:hypothetical protein
MAYSSATTSAISKENNVIQKPSSDNSFDATQSLNPDLSESYVRFIVMLLWMLSHVSTPQLQPLERRERPIILHRLPSPRQESSRAADPALSHHTILKSTSRPTTSRPTTSRPTDPPGPIVPLCIDIHSILIACRGLGIRGGPKMQRLGQAITRRSQRISRSLRLSYPWRSRPGSDSWYRVLKVLATAVNCRQDVLLSQPLPSQVHFFGSFILRYLAGGSAKDTVDGETEFLDLLALAINKYAPE